LWSEAARGVPESGSTCYACMSSRLDPDGVCCVRTNGLQADELVSEEILRCPSPLGIEASLAALQAHQAAAMPPGSARLRAGEPSHEVSWHSPVSDARRVIAAHWLLCSQ